MNLHRFLAVVCVSLGSLAVDVPNAWAQSGTLAATVVESSDVTSGQRDAVKQFIDAHKDGLKGEATEIRRSRNALLEPLRNPRITVAFRLEYTRQLTPVLRPLVSDVNDVVAVNALRVVGELATASSVELLTEALKDKRPGVRYIAASGFENTFQAMQRSVPAVGGSQALRMVDTLKAAIASEKDARVLEGLVLALQEASRIPKRQVEGMRDAGTLALAEAVSAKAMDRKIGLEADAAFRRAVFAIRTAATNPDINEAELNQATLRAAAGMAGDLLALVSERLKAGIEPDADMALMVTEAERVIFFIQPKLSTSGEAAKEFKLADLVQQKKTAEYQQQVMQLIGPNGVLTSEAFRFPNDRFVKGR